MRMKRMLSLICCLLFCLLTIHLPCYADSDMSDTMVYASGEKLNQIYELLQNDSFDIKNELKMNSLTIVKESITPVYTVDLLEYARSGKMNVVPLWKSHADFMGREYGNVYVAKTITSDKQYGGNIMFYIENGVAYNIKYSPSEYSPLWYGVGGMYPASSSYADHAERISDRLKIDDFVSVYDVKYVYINWIGDFFYVNDGDHERFFSIGYISTKASNKYIDTVDYSMDASELFDISNDYLTKYNAFLEEKAEWEALHPGENWNITGVDNVSPIISGSSHVDNILDIASYLNNDYSLSIEQGVNEENIYDADIGSVADVSGKSILIGVAVILVFSAIGIVVWKKRMVGN